MIYVVDIIRSVMPEDRSKDDGDEIEIPLDALDTATLRRLQKYVAESNEKRKRTVTGQRRGGDSGKRAKKDKIENGLNPVNVSSTSYAGTGSSGLGFADIHDEEVEAADLLFGADFDEIRAAAQGQQDSDDDVCY